MTYMDRALSLAQRARGSASPNPAVGSVVVKDGSVVGEGWTQPPGGDHAEIVALRQAGLQATGATLYSTLEPCNHTGRTPPCTEAIREAGVADVHAATIDPNPLVAGKGIARLNELGIATHVGEAERESLESIEAYRKWITTGRPFVVAKFAMSLDGKIATRAGDSRWISGPESRAFVHELRATHDAVMVGVNTVLADDPSLTARNGDGSALGRQPLRVVVDGKGRTPEGAKLLAQPGKTLVALGPDGGSAEAGLRAAGAEVAVLTERAAGVDLAELLGYLGAGEVTSVLVEGGGTLLGSLFDLALVDKVVAFVAPTIVGGAEAPTPVGGRGVAAISEAIKLNEVKIERYGDDVAVIGYC